MGPLFESEGESIPEHERSHQDTSDGPTFRVPGSVVFRDLRMLPSVRYFLHSEVGGIILLNQGDSVGDKHRRAGVEVGLEPNTTMRLNTLELGDWNPSVLAVHQRSLTVRRLQNWGIWVVETEGGVGGVTRIRSSPRGGRGLYGRFRLPRREESRAFLIRIVVIIN